jgi:hypothetical protein
MFVFVFIVYADGTSAFNALSLSVLNVCIADAGS